ncbi:hypothetical protein [Youngiibacter multivorans]|uniref:hypothetical protein n=1 Tax=Youngiibacter multivorans TaxID=937251 RepID=UPI001AE454D1|nr:hypothetical protein [Youngiibacter multivorans]
MRRSIMERRFSAYSMRDYELGFIQWLEIFQSEPSPALAWRKSRAMVFLVPCGSLQPGVG